MNFKEAIDLAWQLGIRKYVTEFWYVGNENWKEDLVFAHDMFEKMLDGQMTGKDEKNVES